MRPYRHYLAGNKGTEGPTSLLFFDTESDQELVPGTAGDKELSLRLWCATYVRREGTEFTRAKHFRGKTAGEFWAMVERLLSWRRPLWAFAHNIGHDLTQLAFWQLLEDGVYTPGPVPREPDADTGKPRPPWRGRMILAGRPTFLILRHARGTLKLVNSGNYWPESLQRVGTACGVPKLERPAWSDDDEAWYTYCAGDVATLRAAVENLLRWWIKEDCGVFQPTAPGLAMRHFQHTCKARSPDGQSVNIVVESKSPARKLERRAYRGPRVEAFFTGTMQGPIWHLDANGLYLAVMADNLYPRARTQKLLAPTPELLQKKMLTQGAAADVLIETHLSGRTYPVLHEGHLLFATGRFYTTLCGPELYRALEAGDVAEVGTCHLYSMQAIFRDWAAAWYARRLDARKRGDFGEEMFCKLIGTSLHGKFGQRGEWWKDHVDPLKRKGWGERVFTNRKTKRVEHWRWVGGHCQRKVVGEESKTAVPIIAAYVTAYAREWMRLVFDVVGKDSLLYTAADSVICTRPGYERLVQADLVHPEELGKFKVKGVYRDAEILGCNHYRLGDVYCAAGLYGTATADENGELWAEQWDQLPGIIRQRPGPTSIIHRVKLEAMRHPHKNEPGKGGFRVPKFLNPHSDLGDALPAPPHWPVAHQ